MLKKSLIGLLFVAALGASSCSSDSDGSKFYGGSLIVEGAENGLIELKSGAEKNLQCKVIEPNLGSSVADYRKFEIRMHEQDYMNPSKRNTFQTTEPTTIKGMVNGKARLYVFATSNKHPLDIIQSTYEVEVTGQVFVTELTLKKEIIDMPAPLGNSNQGVGYKYGSGDYSVAPQEATVHEVELIIKGDGAQYIAITSDNVIYAKAPGKVLVDVRAIGAESDSKETIKTITINVLEPIEE